MIFIGVLISVTLQMRIRDTSTVYAYAITLCMGSFVFGYELSSFSNLSQALAYHLPQSDVQQVDRLIVYFNLVFAASTIAGIIFYHYFKNYGWILTFKLTDTLTILAAVIGIMSLSISTQTWSRVLFGFVTGINTILIPTFLTSILPGPMGAPAGTLNQLFIVLGIFMGLWMGHLTLNHPESPITWRIIVGLPIIPALIRQHFLANHYPYEALQVYMEDNDTQLLQHYLDRVYTDATIQNFKQSKRLTEQDLRQQTSPLCEPSNHYYRVRMTVALAISGLNQLSGAAALSYFISAYAFPQMSSNHRLDILVNLNLLQVLVTLFSGQLLQKYGRRAFMQEGIKIIIFSLLLIGVVQIIAPQYRQLTLILIFVHMIGISLSYGPCTFLIGTEVVNDIFYPALLQWILITLNFAVVGPIVKVVGLGPLCLLYCILQVVGYFFLQTFQIETQGKLRRNVYRQYRELKLLRKSQKTQAQQGNELREEVKLNDGYFSFQQ